jgi:8-amino-7-oxononanoate synthase
MSSIRKNIQQKLEKRKSENAFRFLHISQNNQIDFASNDYLGLAKEVVAKEQVDQLLKEGSTGSRLITGTSKMHIDLEDQLAQHYYAESALLYNSGYDANIGVLSAVLTRHHTVVIDEYVHASIKDGVRLSEAKMLKFKHNDISDLKRLLEQQEDVANVLVVVESIYSMDGDEADLMALIDVKHQYGFELMVDEAHSNGLYGPNGEGILCFLGIQDEVFIRVNTFGKALGSHGAVVLGPKELKDYLINFSRSLIYTTALPEIALNSIKIKHDKMSKQNHNKLQITALCSLFNFLIEESEIDWKKKGIGPIFSLIIPGNEAVKAVANLLQSQGFDIRPILSPTVKFGEERLRIIIHAFNKEEEVRSLVNSLKKAYLLSGI